ncbi:DUF305 domain-containing protein [Azohydromonas caseinilytica]|uniref:DUF305 domain-containing protein n=1 Tax=Azohydromonas caseinilytica TaxID=2728836 RepID=A0A848FF37_9BURK|nr:DUF305 domain-containing protein [Azohydromonas caseinilytica]NML16939.1 DUF305 domain-containing protein [Azohydromonas caseinilytica]
MAVSLPVQPLHAQEGSPGRGLAAGFEIDFLKSIIDHHYSALRMSELAAGTDTTRNAELGRYAEGTSPTPGTAATPAKARSGSIRSMARTENRMQREEIAHAQMFLKNWYGQTHEPQLDDMGRRQIQLLESTSAGAEFDHAFLETMARHHYMAVTMATACLVAADIKHKALHRYCSGIQHNQLNGIEEMRDMLCHHFEICDYQPLRGLRGQHTGNDSEQGSPSN